MESKDLYKLDEPFGQSELEWRVQSSGMSNGRPYARILCYVTARAIQNRLDEVCGKAGWMTEYKSIGHNDFICKLSINVDGVWVSKEDGAGETNIEEIKGGISGALKRVASQWGIGRYLYSLGESWATFTDDRNAYGSVKPKGSDRYYYWNPPAIENQNHPIPQPKPVQAEPIEAKLNRLIEQYAGQLQGKPIDTIIDALVNGNADAKNDVYQRTITYLGKKGVKVA